MQNSAKLIQFLRTNTTSNSKPLLYHLSSIPFCKLRTLITTAGTAATNAPSKDDYFAAIHHISNIVRRDFYMERTLNKLRITVNSELVFRVLRACSNSGTESFRFFNWACSHNPSYQPTSVEFEEMVKILASAKKYETMWKTVHQMKTQNLSLSPEIVSSVIEIYGKHGLVDQAVEIFNKCKVFNCPQNLRVFNSLLFALCEVKMFHGAYALIRRMIRKGVNPDKRTYAILVNAWCYAGKMRGSAVSEGNV